MKLAEREIKSLVNRIGPSLGFDYTSWQFPEGRDDVAAVIRTAENGSTYGYDTLYLVWKDEKGELHHRRLMDTSSTKDYVHFDSVESIDNKIIIKVSSGGSYSGRSWKRVFSEKV